MVFRYRISDRSLLKNVYSIVTPSYLSKKNRLLYLSVSGLSLASGIITDMYKEGCEKCLHSWLCPLYLRHIHKNRFPQVLPLQLGPQSAYAWRRSELNLHTGAKSSWTCSLEPSHPAKLTVNPQTYEKWVFSTAGCCHFVVVMEQSLTDRPGVSKLAVYVNYLDNFKVNKGYLSFPQNSWSHIQKSIFF